MCDNLDWLWVKSGKYALLQMCRGSAVAGGWSANRTVLPQLEPDIVLTNRTPPAWMRLAHPW
jgi:hypothetical protein